MTAQDLFTRNPRFNSSFIQLPIQHPHRRTMTSLASSLRKRLQRSSSRKSLKVDAPKTPEPVKRSISSRPVSAHSASTSGYRSTSVEDEELAQNTGYYTHTKSSVYSDQHRSREYAVTPAPRRPQRLDLQRNRSYGGTSTATTPVTPHVTTSPSHNRYPATPPRMPLRRAKSLSLIHI